MKIKLLKIFLYIILICKFRFQQNERANSVDPSNSEHDDHASEDQIILPHSAPSSLFYTSSLGACRRASSFPLAFTVMQATEKNAIAANERPQKQPATTFLSSTLKVFEFYKNRKTIRG